MPIYEYHCKNCLHQFEVLEKLNEPPTQDCPSCHQKAAERLVSAAGFELKGTGWYATDFKSKPKSEAKTCEASQPCQDACPKQTKE